MQKNKVTLECSICNGFVPNCDPEILAITCHECVSEMMAEISPLPKAKKATAEGYPKGWRFMKVFVHKDGTVYHKGIIQPELKSTLPITVIAVKPKKSKVQKAQDKQDKLVKLNKLKTDLKKVMTKAEAKKLQSKIKTLQKSI